MLVFASILLSFCIPLSRTFNTELTTVDLYGPMLVANDQIVVSIVDRLYPWFVVYRRYAPVQFCTIFINTINEAYITSLAVPRDGSAAPDIFFYQSMIINYGTIGDSIVVRVDMSISSCNYSTFLKILSGSRPNDYSILGMDPTGQVLLQTYNIFSEIWQLYPNTSTSWNTIPWLDGTNFVPYAIDITYGEWGVIAGATAINSIYVPTLYLITFPSSLTSGNTNYNVINVWRAPFVYPWQSLKARQASGSNDSNPMYGMSVSINNKGDILFGVQSMNTVFHLYVNPANPISFTFQSSRIYSVTTASIGFGKSVGWLDNFTAVILANNFSLDYSEWRSSQIEIYDLSNGQTLDDTTGPYSSFPSALQPVLSPLGGSILLMVATYTGSVIFMNSVGLVDILLPSPSGYYTQTDINNGANYPVYFSSSTICPSGTRKKGPDHGKYLFDTCEMCPEGTYNPGGLANSSIDCLPCVTTKYFCPFGSSAEVPLSYLDPISQVTAFPKSPDVTDFEDILLLNMFNTNFDKTCLTTAPFFWILIMIGIALLFFLLMGIIKLTGICTNVREKIELVFRHFDIINEGEVSSFIVKKTL
jgi:hypothetical protein